MHSRPDTREGFRKLIESIERSLHSAFSSSSSTSSTTTATSATTTTAFGNQSKALVVAPQLQFQEANNNRIILAPYTQTSQVVDLVRTDNLRGIYEPPERLNRVFPELTLPPIATDSRYQPTASNEAIESSAMDVDEAEVFEVVEPNRIYSSHLDRDRELAESLWRLHEDAMMRYEEGEEGVSERVQKMMEDKEREESSVGGVSADYIATETERRLGQCNNEWMQKARDFISSGRCSDSKIVIEKYDIPMNERKLSCLKPGVWLNDEVVNFYMCMLQERDAELCQAEGPARKPSHFFNSFFISKLNEGNQYNYKNVKRYNACFIQSISSIISVTIIITKYIHRWTKKVDIFALDKIFCPINISNTHWTLAVIHMADKRIQYYDSMAGSGAQYVKILSKYIQDEAADKKGNANYDMSDWTLQHCDRQCTPQQQNGSDCGVFSIMFADFLAAKLPLSFDQSNVSQCRLKICASILGGKLWYCE